MFSKSITDRSAPHSGSGRSTKCRYDLTRNSVIHSGSDLCAEISRTTSSSNPRRVRNTDVTSSWNPYRYSPIAVACASAGVSSVSDTGDRLLVHAVRRVAVPFQLVGKLRAARARDAAIHQYVDHVGADVAKQARV